VIVPDEYAGLAIDEASRRLREEHHATLLAVNRAGSTFMNPATDFVVVAGDEALVVATKLGKLAPVRGGLVKREAMAAAAQATATAEG
jgi:voltage-gated potassium channel